MTKFRTLLSNGNTVRKKVINWHPGHMRSGWKAMVGKLKTVDCIIEVHDARIPFTGRNDNFKTFLGTVKPSVLVLNKCDLADLANLKHITQRLNDQGDKRVVLSCLTGNSLEKHSSSFSKILQHAVDAINTSSRYNREGNQSFKLMVVGIPNCGKSTLINKLRNHYTGRGGEPAKTGAVAGVTKHVDFMIKACSRPLIYILDTPGVLEPGCTRNHDEAMKLALCSSISDNILDPRDLSRYLLDFLNQKQNHFYTKVLGLDEPVCDIHKLAAKLKEIKLQEVGENSKELLNEDNLYWRFIKDFRKGIYGQVMFD